MSNALTTREAELEALIAEQQADDTDRIWQRERSLDAPLGDGPDAGSFHEVVGDADERLADMLGENETWVQLVKVRRVTQEDVSYWRYLRVRQGWSTTRIAAECGVSSTTVWRHVGRKRRRGTWRTQVLTADFKKARRSYEAGARLIDVAQELYEKAGYASAESCYQSLRLLFIDRRVPIRPPSWKHGMRSRTATREQYISYWKRQNEKARDRRRAEMEKCAATTREGRRCSRWAREGLSLCNVHAGLSGGPKRWTTGTVLAALRRWRRDHGDWPKPRDWHHADTWHPNFKTVYSLFGSWPNAIAEADAIQELAA